MQKTTKSPTDFLPGGLSKEDALSLIRKIMGDPRRELKGQEREQVLTMLSLMDPVEAFNNQRYWTDVYIVGKIKYHVTSGVDWSEDELDPMVEEYINE